MWRLTIIYQVCERYPNRCFGVLYSVVPAYSTKKGGNEMSINLMPDAPIAIVAIHLAALGGLSVHAAIVSQRRRNVRRQNRSPAHK